MAENKQWPTTIIYHLNLPKSDVLSDENIDNALQGTYYTLHRLMQALMNQALNNPITIICVHEHQDDESSLFVESLAGFAKALRLENSNIICKIIDVKGEMEALKIPLMDELYSNDIYVRYDELGNRYVKRFEKFDTSVAMLDEKDMPIKPQGVYLITGGAGGLGLITAHFLAKNYQAKIVLTGRSELNDKQQAAVTELQKLGSEVLYVRGDITLRTDVSQLYQTIKNRFGVLHGIIHAAGVSKPSLLRNKKIANVASIINPKVYGTYYLDDITQTEPLDFVVYYSSIASVFGDEGLTDYAYANNFMDAYANFRNALVAKGMRSGKAVCYQLAILARRGDAISGSKCH